MTDLCWSFDDSRVGESSVTDWSFNPSGVLPVRIFIFVYYFFFCASLTRRSVTFYDMAFYLRCLNKVLQHFVLFCVSPSLRSQRLYFIVYTSQKLFFFNTLYLILSFYTGYMLLFCFLSSLTESPPSSTRGIVCFWSYVDNIYKSFSICFDINFLISLHTRVTEQVYLLSLFIYF